MVDREAVRALMERSEAVYLATVEGTSPRIRALVNLCRPDLYPDASRFCRTQHGILYFTTSAASAKVRELRANPAASAYYCDPKSTHGISFSGNIEILTDPKLKRTLWSEDWRIYWSGPDDADYVVLRMKPTYVGGWWGSGPARLAADVL